MFNNRKEETLMSLIKRSDWPLAGSLFSDLFDDERFFNSPWLRGQQLPAVNVKENDTNYEIELAVPGYKKEDFNISLEQGVLTISAERKNESERKEDKYTRREFGYISFSRSFNVPQGISDEDVSASFENGILKLSIDKKRATEQKPKKPIQIS
jgi:HSP20 family protein